MKYEFHPEALSEYQEAACFYAARQPGLEIRFIAAIEETIARVLENPERWRVLEEDIRRCLTRVFPYALLYTIESDYVLIVAVMHCSREPGYWKHRVESA